MSCKDLEKRVEALEKIAHIPKKFVTHTELLLLLSDMRKELSIIYAHKAESQERLPLTPLPDR